MKNIFYYLLALLILVKSSDLSAQKCDSSLYDTKYRNYNTAFIGLKTISTGTDEADYINRIIFGQMEKLPNNVMHNKSLKNQPGKRTKVIPDRIISGNIKKTVIKKERYAGNTGKDQYLIETYNAVYYEMEIELKEDRGSTLYRFKKYFAKDELGKQANDFFTVIKPFYATPFEYCAKRDEPVEYFCDLYTVHGFPAGDYREFLVYSPGAGVSGGIKGPGAVNSLFSVYLETAYNAAANPDINYAITLQGGIGAGYDIAFTLFHLAPGISLGYIYSFYNVKYSDMETFFRNMVIRSSVEINTVIFNKTLFIKPGVSGILEKGNTLFSIDLLLGIKIKL